jgi:nucleoside phosphorylase/tetratricopeptide (TPR) repeat protein
MAVLPAFRPIHPARVRTAAFFEAQMPRAVIVTALALEFDAVLRHLANPRNTEHPQGSQYLVGDFDAEDLSWEVLVAETGPGNPSAAVETERALQFFNPEVAIFVGVGGGVKDVRIGDLVIATKVYDTDAGKEGDEFLPRPTAPEPSYRLLELAKATRRYGQWLLRLTDSEREPGPTVYLGAIASGQQVVASVESPKSKLIATHYSDALAVDMESVGFMRAIQARNSTPSLIVRGISDVRDAKSPDDDTIWQPKMAARAAAFAIELLAQYREPQSGHGGKRIAKLPPPVAIFEGREVELAALSQELKRGRATVVALTGLGGIGKTRLSVEFARRFEDAYDVIWFVRAADAPTAHGDLAALAQVLDLPEVETGEQDDAVNAARSWLATHGRWLIILDDVDDPALVRELLPEGDGHVLVTTRRETGWRQTASPLRVGVLGRDSSIRLLQERSGDGDAIAAAQLAEELGDLPLALMQAGAYVDAVGIDLRTYVERFRAARRELLEAGVPDDYPETVGTTWLLALEQLASSDAALFVLQTAAFCAPQPIPRDVFFAPNIRGAPFTRDNMPLELDQAVEVLLRFSLVTADARDIQLHRLVQEVIRQRLGDARATWLRSTQVLLEHNFPTEVDTGAYWEEANSLLPHVLSAARHARALAAADALTAAMLYRVARYLAARYDLALAHELMSEVVALKTAFEGETLDVAAALTELGKIDAARNHLSDAETALKRSLEIVQRVAPRDDQQLAIHLTTLGSIQRQRGEPRAAVTTLSKSLDLITRTHGTASPERIPALVNLANAVSDLGDPRKAIALLEQALHLAETTHAGSQTRLATILANLGARFRDLGDLARAESLLRRALAINEELYGVTYGGLAPVLVNLGAVHLRARDPQAARASLERALDLEHAALGPDHLDLARTYLSLARATALLEDDAQTALGIDSALRIVAKNEDLNPQLTVTLLLEISDFLRQETEQLRRAQAIAEFALDRANQVFGREHVETAYALRTLGVVFRRRSEVESSRALLERSWQLQTEALTILERLLGHNSGPVCDTLSNLGNLSGDLGLLDRDPRRLREALTLLQEAEAIAAQVYGVDTPPYARVIANLAIAHHVLGEEARAQELGQRAFELAPWLFPGGE